VAFGRRHPWALLAVAGTCAVGWAVLATRPELAARPAIQSLAVLPFVNATGEPDGEYLGDGLAESVINALTAVPDLRVAARTRAYRYKGRDDPPDQICRELGVSGLLTGRVVKHGSDLIVQVDLVEGQHGSQLWGGRYTRPLTDLLALQEEIARDVASRLRVRLGQKGEQTLASRLTADPEAYRLYLLGRFHSNQRTEEGSAKSLEYYKRAAERDPTFALAYAGQAEAELHLIATYGAVPPRDGYAIAKAAASKALSLAPERAEVHAPLGYLAMAFEADWVRAETEFRRALELDPAYDLARQWYAYGLVARGRDEEALAQIRQAEARDPASFVTTLDACLIDYYARRFDEGLERCQRVLEMRPTAPLARWARILMYERKGLLSQVEAELPAALAAVDGHPRGMPLAVLLSYYVRVGRRAEAAKLVAEEERAASVRALSMAQLHAVLGEADKAFAWLERANADRDPFLIFLNANSLFDSLHGDPRFRDLTRRVGLPDAPPPTPEAGH
jgi:eukaryotic-like serine/threonine-protein kinase